MRKQLKPFLDTKVKLVGTFERYGSKKEYIGGCTITMLLTDITLQNAENETVTLDHVWINVGKTLGKLNIAEGSILQMNCHVKPYVKGYVDRRNWIDERTIDYGVQRSSAIVILENGKGKTFKDFYKDAKTTLFLSNKYKEII